MESRGIKNYPKRFQSAEGCYSHRAAMAPGIRIKMAHKQFVGLTVPSDDQIYFVNGAVRRAHVPAASFNKAGQTRRGDRVGTRTVCAPTATHAAAAAYGPSGVTGACRLCAPLRAQVWQCPKSEAVDVALLHAHSQQPCAANLPGVQEALGAMLPLEARAPPQGTPLCRLIRLALSDRAASLRPAVYSQAAHSLNTHAMTA
eukprot:6184579-Pleurochrysis_carterae.AAC.1